MSEHQEQCALFEWLKLELPEIERMAFAIPNGGYRHISVARKLHAEGVKPGVPDICIPVPTRQGEPGLFIELKTGKGRTKKHQRAWLTSLRIHGWRAEVCHGFEAARSLIRECYRESP